MIIGETHYANPENPDELVNITIVVPNIAFNDQKLEVNIFLNNIIIGKIWKGE